MTMNLTTRTLLDGSAIDDLAHTVKLTLDTHAPGKWIAVDLEAGSAWTATDTGAWRQASPARRALGAAVLGRRLQADAATCKPRRRPQDIVERLRGRGIADYELDPGIAEDAAREIERLRLALRRATSAPA